METLLPIIIQLITGAAGGAGVGAALKSANMGTLGNIIAGAVGGAGSGQILGMLGMLGGGAMTGDAAGGGAMGGMIGSAVTGLAGGGVLTAVFGMLRNLSADKEE